MMNSRIAQIIQNYGAASFGVWCNVAASFRMIWLSSKRYPSWSTAKTCFLAEKLGTNQQNIFLKNARVDMLGCPIMMSYDASCPGTLSPARLICKRKQMKLYVIIRHYTSLYVIIRHYTSLYVIIRHYTSRPGCFRGALRRSWPFKLPCSCHANRVRRSCRSPRCSSKLWKCLCQNVSNKTWATHFWHEKLTSNPWATHEQDMRNSFFCPVCSWLKRRYGPRQPLRYLIWHFLGHFLEVLCHHQ